MFQSKINLFRSLGNSVHSILLLFGDMLKATVPYVTLVCPVHAEVRVGLHQGSALSPQLSITVIDVISEKVSRESHPKQCLLMTW